MTQKEIAKQLGISVSTVSRVLNNIPKACSTELCEKIWHLARTSNYQFNESARGLRHSAPNDVDKEETIYFISFWRKSSPKSKNRFYENVLRGAEKEALLHHKTICSGHYFDDTDNIELFSEALRQKKPTIILGRVPKQMRPAINVPHAPFLQVALNTNCNHIDSVSCDGYIAAENAVKFLHWCGHEYILYLGHKNNEIRYHGFSNQIGALHLPCHELSYLESDMTVEGGYRVAEIFLRLREKNEFHKRVTAIFCANDNLAVGAYQKFQEHNLDIPKDISIISVDDIQEAGNLHPALTTMSIPQEEMGNLAVQLLLLRKTNKLQSPLHVELPVKLVVRDSVIDLRKHSIQELNRMIHYDLAMLE